MDTFDKRNDFELLMIQFKKFKEVLKFIFDELKNKFIKT